MRDGAAADVDTATQILDVAERLVQTRGYNGFSYADVAAEVGVTKAALHYHFATKAKLGKALVDRYAETFGAALTAAERTRTDAAAQLAAYVLLYVEVVRGQRMCLCGMLAAEYPTLPEPMQRAVVHFFDDNERWLAATLGRGRQEGSLTFDGRAEEVARTVVTELQGSMLIARLQDDASRFEDDAERIVDALRPSRRRG